MAAEHILTPTPLLCAELIASLSAVEMSFLFRGITVMRVVTAPDHSRQTRTLCSYREKPSGVDNSRNPDIGLLIVTDRLPAR